MNVLADDSDCRACKQEPEALGHKRDHPRTEQNACKKKRALNKRRKLDSYQPDISSSGDESASEESSFNPPFENIQQEINQAEEEANEFIGNSSIKENSSDTATTDVSEDSGSSFIIDMQYSSQSSSNEERIDETIEEMVSECEDISDSSDSDTVLFIKLYCF
ncbi:uncharacterized protein LOC117176631 [Belonocnema kinseyi]|uniref:uncharacterized protein LOC117176631 n=1 Tax=Belonocnema kinseyi TaxID=2817044 RepID=UPI00143D0259|nr:uncharacterized protein LOC117176631 [Belonocnema kinseyi]